MKVIAIFTGLFLAGPALATELQLAPVYVIENQATLLKLEVPAGTIFVAEPDIASVQVTSGSTIFVMGHRSGRTVLFALDEQEDILMRRRIVVQRSLGAVEATTRGQ
ncbi:MAG: pilus assembly protein N-terminal domain-containing protein [Pseudomonadota bacterium]